MDNQQASIKFKKGDKIKNWEIISDELFYNNSKKYPNWKPKSYWILKCKCGTERQGTIAALNNIMNDTFDKSLKNDCKQCRAIDNIDLSDNKKYQSIYIDYKNQAKKRGLDFILEKEDAINLFKSKCYFCGKNPENRKVYHRQRIDYELKPFYNYQGIDRKNSKYGYSKENCVACCKHCNFAKRELSMNDFDKLIDNLSLMKLQRLSS